MVSLFISALKLTEEVIKDDRCHAGIWQISAHKQCEGKWERGKWSYVRRFGVVDISGECTAMCSVSAQHDKLIGFQITVVENMC